VNGNKEMEDSLKAVKKRIFEYIEINLKYYIKDEDELKRDKERLYIALRDMFKMHTLEELEDTRNMCKGNRWNFLNTKKREQWGKLFLVEFYRIIKER
jgi:hypothetical protein